MMQLADIHDNVDLINEIDWDMGPEDAVTMHLEWGNNPVIRRKNFRSTKDFSTYFVVNTWREPRVYLIRRNSDDMQELAEIRLPPELEARFLENVGHNKGVFAIDGEVKTWLKSQLGVG